MTTDELIAKARKWTDNGYSLPPSVAKDLLARVEVLEKALREARMHLGSTSFHYHLDGARRVVNAALAAGKPTTTDLTRCPTAPSGPESR